MYIRCTHILRDLRMQCNEWFPPLASVPSFCIGHSLTHSLCLLQRGHPFSYHRHAHTLLVFVHGPIESNCIESNRIDSMVCSVRPSFVSWPRPQSRHQSRHRHRRYRRPDTRTEDPAARSGRPCCSGGPSSFFHQCPCDTTQTACHNTWQR